MDSLLCDEQLWRSPTSEPNPQHDIIRRLHNHGSIFSFHSNSEDRDEAVRICIQKEVSYMPQPGYEKYLRSTDLMKLRHQALLWTVKTGKRLNLIHQTIFDAVNYLDRFISRHCNFEWKHWIIELLSISCLSIAIKSDEIEIPSLHEIQMEDLDHRFHPAVIQRMELIVLRSLTWRMNCVTPHSYVDMMTCYIDINQPGLHVALTVRITELLLGALSDPKFVEFRQSIVAVAALKCSLEELLPSKADLGISNIVSVIGFDQEAKDELRKCYQEMEERIANPLYSLMSDNNSTEKKCPQSPVTVMLLEQMDTFEFDVFWVSQSSSIETSQRKRKRNEEDDDKER